MRIWSLHPSLLDAKGLVALWRETLLAQAVLAGKTKGYTHHPQLKRFRESADPLGNVSRYLSFVQQEADARGYNFDRTRILPFRETVEILSVTQGQLDYEWRHLLNKLETRDPARFAKYVAGSTPLAHQLFVVIEGPVASWEKL